MSVDSKRKAIRLVSFIGDAASSFFCAYFVSVFSESADDTRILHGLALSVAVIFFYYLLDMYSFKTESIYNTIISTVIGVIAAYICLHLVAFLPFFERPRTAYWMRLFLLLLPTELLWRVIMTVIQTKTVGKRSILILENMQNTSRLARKLKYASDKDNNAWYHLLDENDETELHTVLDELVPRFDAVFISSQISDKTAERILYRALSLNKEVNVLADVDGVTTLHGQIYPIEDTPVIIKKGIHLTLFQRVVKRLFDIVFSLAASVIVLPVIGICAIAIKLDSPGPVIYKQERYTIHKKIFKVYKLRTMYTDAEKGGARFAAANDPRITRVGRVLRALRLDELPQIFNILGGSMSVVGPRPERPVFADVFSEAVASYDMRYCLKAGLTGYAQVYGKYNTRVSDKILMDITYGTTFSLFLDIKLVLLTIKTMFIKSATEGVDDERDTALSATDKELLRRIHTERFMEQKTPAAKAEPENAKEPASRS